MPTKRFKPEQIVNLLRQVEVEIASPRRASDATRFSLVLLSGLFAWREALAIVKPDTFIRWHLRGFRFY
ncbi:MAG: hypothetical protein ACYDA9_02860 [Terriglobia bacterium]